MIIYAFSKNKKKIDLLDLREMVECNFKFLVKRRNFVKMNQFNQEVCWGTFMWGWDFLLLSKIFSKIYILH